METVGLMAHKKVAKELALLYKICNKKAKEHDKRSKD
jgi:hypothetical protein